MTSNLIFTRVRHTVKRAGEANIAQSAAGLAYYTLFSVFPLLLLLVSIGSTLLKDGGITARIVGFIDQTLPGSGALIQENLPALEQGRAAIGLVGLITLFWSASNVFMVLSANVNRAWPGSQRRNYIRRRLVALGIVGVLVSILILYILLIALLRFLAWLQVPVVSNQDLLGSTAWEWISNIIAWLLIFCLTSGIYYWVPNAQVPPRSALTSAGWATLLLFVINRLFTLLLSLVIQRYELIYGSLSSVLAFLVNIYFSSYVVLAGAHLCAAISEDDENRTSEHMP